MSQRAVVIGGGIVGCSTALALARNGWSVLVVERLADVGQGSTARSSTVVRCHYTRPEGVRLAVEGRSVWQNWAEYVGLSQPRATYKDVGVLFLLKRHEKQGSGPETLGMKAEMDARAIDARVQMMEFAGVDVSFLNTRRLQKQFPEMVFQDSSVVGLWEPDSGYVANPTGAVEDLREAAEREGVAFLFETELVGGRSEWVEHRRVLREVLIRRADGATATFGVDAVVNCAGPHSHSVNVALDCPLPLSTTPQRQFVVEATWSNPTPLPAMADLDLGFYIRPDRDCFKIGAVLPRDHVSFHHSPDLELNMEQQEAFQTRFLQNLHQRLPEVTLSDIQVKVGIYDWTVSDSYPLLGGTDLGRYYVAVGTSGAWFKSGPVIGQLLAERIVRDFCGDTRTLVTLPRCGLKIDLARFSPYR